MSAGEGPMRQATSIGRTANETAVTTPHIGGFEGDTRLTRTIESTSLYL